MSLSEEEIQRISKYLGLSEKKFLEDYTIKKGEKRIEMKVKEGYCIFFDKEKGLCKIHPVKPGKCKEWPFPPVIFKDKENFLIIKESCLGLKEFSLEDLKNLRS